MDIHFNVKNTSNIHLAISFKYYLISISWAERPFNFTRDLLSPMRKEKQDYLSQRAYHTCLSPRRRSSLQCRARQLSRTTEISGKTKNPCWGRHAKKAISSNRRPAKTREYRESRKLMRARARLGKWYKASRAPHRSLEESRSVFRPRRRDVRRQCFGKHQEERWMGSDHAT